MSDTQASKRARSASDLPILHEAIQLQGVHLCEEILNKDPLKVGELDQDGYEPIHRASELGNIEILRLLVERKADPDRLVMIPTRVQMVDGNEVTMKGRPVSPILLAALGGHSTAIHCLVEMNANINR